MATKAEVKAIVKEIAEHRVNQPAMANGLILALAILNDEHEPKYIDIKAKLAPVPRWRATVTKCVKRALKTL